MEPENGWRTRLLLDIPPEYKHFEPQNIGVSPFQQSRTFSGEPAVSFGGSMLNFLGVVDFDQASLAEKLTS